MTASTEMGDDILSLMRQGQKIEAIKLYRARTGAGLAEAKAAVEAMERGDAPPPAQTAPAPEGVDDRLWELLKKGEKIQAIKLYREQTGAGLAEAKAAVEAIARRHGLDMKGVGCAGMVLLEFVAAIGVVRWFCN